MGYFPNGTAGEIYEADYCSRCAHENEEQGCAVMLAHLLYSYDLCNEEKHPGKHMLDMLIPVKKDGSGNEQCAMFIPRELVRRSRASRSAQHKGPDGGPCRNNVRKPVTNDAGEVIGETCAGCGTPFALPGRAGLNP